MNAICMRERKLPTYHDLEEDYTGWEHRGASFEFDHKSPSRGKYRERDGIRAYESGYVEVKSYIYRNQGLRSKLNRYYGLTLMRPKECQGIKFFTPDNVPVAVGALTTNMLFLDGQTRRAYSYKSVSGKASAENPYRIDEVAKIDFAAPGAMPVAYALVHANLPDKARVKAVMQEHKEFFKACATTMHLMQGETIIGAVIERTNKVLDMILRGEEVDFTAIPLQVQVRIGQYVSGKGTHVDGEVGIGIRARLTALSVKPFTFPYLNIVMVDDNG